MRHSVNMGRPSLDGDPLLGSVLDGRYRIRSPLGRGRAAAVFRAEQVHLHDRACAVKVVSPGLIDSDASARLEREAGLIARLRSPHIVRLLDRGATEDGRPYLVTELLEGHSLEAELRDRRPMPARRAIAIIDAVLAALEEAHAHGVVHRDLHPGNVFLVAAPAGREHVVVLDFGLGKALDASPYATRDEALTTWGARIGTPTHMAPEQFEGKVIDTRADLYAVGVLIYRLLSGEPPFSALADVPIEVRALPSTLRIGWQHMRQPPARIDGITDSLWAAIDRLLAKKPVDRFRTAGDARSALAAVLEVGSQPNADEAMLEDGSTVDERAMTLGILPSELDRTDDEPPPPEIFPPEASELEASELEAGASSSRWLWVAVGVGIGVLAGAAAWFAVVAQ